MGRKKRGDISPKKIRVSYTISPGLIDRLESLAKTHHQSVSSVFEEAVEHFLDMVDQMELEELVDIEEQSEIAAAKRSVLIRRPKDD